jgi:hypothetical protein
MILELKVRYDSDLNKYTPTNVFHINGYVNYYLLRPILTEVTEFVNSNAVEEFVYKNEIRFHIEEGEEGYVNCGPIRHVLFSTEDLEEFVSRASGIPREEMFARSRKRIRVIPRAVIYSACMFFGKMSSIELEKYSFDHASVLHLINKSLPSSMITGEPLALKLVTLVAERYGNHQFFDYCKTYRSRELNKTNKASGKYKGVRLNKGNKFSAIYEADGKRVHIGVFNTRLAASQAREQYINNLKQI